MNPLLPYVAVAGLAFGIGGFFYGQHVGSEHEIAKQANLDVAIAKVSEAAQQAAATEIGKIKIVNQTNRTRLEREIVKVPDLTACHAGPVGKRVLDDALEGKAGSADPVSGGELPGVEPAP